MPILGVFRSRYFYRTNEIIFVACLRFTDVTFGFRPFISEAISLTKIKKNSAQLVWVWIENFLIVSNELCPMWLTHRVISDRVHRLLVTLSYFRPDRFVQLLSLIPILILLLYFLVSGCLTSLC